MDYDNDMPDPLDIIDGTVIKQVICRECGIDITAAGKVSGYYGMREKDGARVLLLTCPVCRAGNEVEIEPHA